MGYIPEELVEEIRLRNDIVDVIADYVRLKKQGRNFAGLCPFHSEKTPSFVVHPDNQVFRCYGCGEGGNVFGFLMKKEGLTFPEAVKLLADKSGIKLPDPQDPAEHKNLKLREEAHRLNELARDFYRHVLQNHEVAGVAREYLAKRGVNPEMSEIFQLGYALPGWDNLLTFLKKKGCGEKQLEKLGLVTAREKATTGYYDRFRHRLMFPIWDTRGKVIGFGGRVLDDTLPKYLNSPETPVFNKSYLLYGLHLAAPHIREQDEVVIVEGYMDVLTAHQFGVKNVVASLGTAFTREQGKLLMRYTQNVVISYDADTAGVSATLRGMEILQDMGCRVKVLSVPKGKDPDEYIRNNGPEAFRELVKNRAKSFFDYLFSRVLEKNDFHKIEGKVKVVSEIIPSIIKLHSEVEKEQQVKKVAETLGLKTESIWSEIRKYLEKSRNNRHDRDKNVKKRDNNIDSAPALTNSSLFSRGDARRKAEEGLVYCLLHYPDLISRVEGQIGVNFFTEPEYLSIINILIEVSKHMPSYEPAMLYNHIREEAAVKVLTRLSIREIPLENPGKFLDDCIAAIKEDVTRMKREEILKQLEQADRDQDHEIRKKLLQEYQSLLSK